MAQFRQPKNCILMISFAFSLCFHLFLLALKVIVPATASVIPHRVTLIQVSPENTKVKEPEIKKNTLKEEKQAKTGTPRIVKNTPPPVKIKSRELKPPEIRKRPVALTTPRLLVQAYPTAVPIVRTPERTSITQKPFIMRPAITQAPHQPAKPTADNIPQKAVTRETPPPAPVQPSQSPAKIAKIVETPRVEATASPGNSAGKEGNKIEKQSGSGTGNNEKSGSDGSGGNRTTAGKNNGDGNSGLPGFGNGKNGNGHDGNGIRNDTGNGNGNGKPGNGTGPGKGTDGTGNGKDNGGKKGNGDNKEKGGARVALNRTGTGASPKPGNGESGYFAPQGSICPLYPEECKQRGETGTVIVEVEILETGKAGKVKITKSSGSAILDDSVLSCIQTCTFKPARKDGSPVTAMKRFVINFNLEDDE